ncbi:hypothetical protein EIP91_009826 [Steccherinum ochraceum]|uniref:Uncharacterized protein n=1 Tax=Steccherinum ochraceum TaxID=92696 RepID=A0A4R0R6M3_9APHY|nr:hypothetical protein EIP91_009826 [Steccherinum ochraceum]
MLRLAAYDGTLLGLEDWENELSLKESRVRGKVEEELVVALAEAMDMYPLNASSMGWETEFMPNAANQSEGCTLSTAYLIVARSLPLVASHRLKALPLGALSSGLLAIIDSAFQSGTFLSSLEQSLFSNPDGKLSISPTSQFATNLQSMSSSPIIVSMAPLSRLGALAVSALADSRPRQAWLVMAEIMQRLEALTRTVEQDWVRTRLSGTGEESDVAVESQEIAKELWSTLKTLLFTTIMIVQAVLTTVVYVPQPTQETPAHTSATTPIPSAHSFALTALHIFSHLSFVLPQFGGVTSTAENSFVELKKVFYTALDVLASDAGESERFVRMLCEDTRSQESSHKLPSRFLHAKKAYSLACIEQLVPVLQDEVLRTEVYPMCQPHLSDSSHREAYESSHSVMLAIFASYAERANKGEAEAISHSHQEGPAFAEQVVPSYVRSLIENSEDGALSTTQLCMAFAALVRSAGAFGSSTPANANLNCNTPSPGDAFAWYCIEALLAEIHSTNNPRPSHTAVDDHLYRLHLTLVATVPSVSLPLLPRLLSEVREAVRAYPVEQATLRGEVVQALLKELSQNVGDREKEYVMGWWYETREELLDGSPLPFSSQTAGDNDQNSEMLVSRL